MTDADDDQGQPGLRFDADLVGTGRLELGRSAHQLGGGQWRDVARSGADGDVDVRLVAGQIQVLSFDDQRVAFVEFDQTGADEGRINGILDVLQALDVLLEVAHRLDVVHDEADAQRHRQRHVAVGADAGPLAPLQRTQLVPFGQDQRLEVDRWRRTLHVRGAEHPAHGPVGHRHPVVHEDHHLRFLDRVEVGAVHRQEASARRETLQRFDLHHRRVFGVGERVERQHPFGLVDGHRQLGDAPRRSRSRTGAQQSGARRVAAVDQTRQVVQEGRHAAAHVQVRAVDR